ncbi:unnamed protein product [Acanthosepion pharaonis]|uniref:Uncharacterized protein n=1 Tax=Acanthosepion pharaonis TaxID=158019 RepID=A0A812D8K1_ACAPH|nr:unnamed protein product [Sepia pharaonis]
MSSCWASARAAVSRYSYRCRSRPVDLGTSPPRRSPSCPASISSPPIPSAPMNGRPHQPARVQPEPARFLRLTARAARISPDQRGAGCRRAGHRPTSNLGGTIQFTSRARRPTPRASPPGNLAATIPSAPSSALTAVIWAGLKGLSELAAISPPTSGRASPAAPASGQCQDRQGFRRSRFDHRFLQLLRPARTTIRPEPRYHQAARLL